MRLQKGFYPIPSRKYWDWEFRAHLKSTLPTLFLSFFYNAIVNIYLIWIINQNRQVDINCVI
jgi:hypothetical protein